jgi:crossover junction endodeoxyribonuclease RuvC
LPKSNDSYTLIGVDPGTNILGYAILHIHGKRLTVPDMGVLHMNHLKSHQEKLKRIFERLQSIMQNYRPREMAIEAPFYGKNPQSMLKLGRAQGVAIAAAVTNGLEVTEYSPKKIKQSVSGNGNASKEQVAAMLESILQVEFDKRYLDASDGLAAALCHYYQSSSLLKGQKKYSDWSAFLKDNPGKVGK